MPEFTTEIDIDAEEFINSCSRSELQELIDILVDDGWVIRKVARNSSPDAKQPNLLELEWTDMLGKLSDLRQRVTPEEDEMIKNLVKKYT
jgi:hypothetical protein